MRHHTEMKPTCQFVRAILSPRRAAYFDRWADVDATPQNVGLNALHDC
jgi:hypothetical protein